MKVNSLLILLLFCSIISSNEQINQDEREVEHCIEYNTIEKSKICLKCEDKYFLYYFNNSCIPCNDSFYGDIGCEGNCVGSEYENNRFIYCEEKGCKEGYYNLNGRCISCDDGSPGCSKCNYETQEGYFTCHECINNEYRLNEFGACQHCNLSLCEVCHYDDINGNAICDKCIDGAYNNSDGECQLCRKVTIYGGNCTICSDKDTDYELGFCSCREHYTLINHSICLDCSSHCLKCDYDNNNDETKCRKCERGYVLNDEKKCISCGDDCKYCSLNENDNSITCLSCYSEILLSDNECISSISGCEKEVLNKFSDYESICENCCSYNYILNQDKSCTYCGSNPDTGNGCSRCLYDKGRNKYKCLECDNMDSYVYINNKFQCQENDLEDNLNLYGCIEANYNEKTKNYECFKCKKDFIYITNDKICKKYNDINISDYCLEAENLGSIEDSLYSCRECKNDLTLITINSTLLLKICYTRQGNLSYCLEGKIDENGNLICTKCVENANLTSSGICECNYDSFGKNHKWCYKCDDEIEGIPGCKSEKGCNYIHSNEELNCNECKEEYFNYTKG